MMVAQAWGERFFVPGLGPSAMAFPLVVGVPFLAVGLLLAARTLLGIDPGDAVAWPDRAGARQVLGLLLITAAYVALLGRLGFALSNFILGLATLKLLGQYRWWVVVLVALATAVLASLVFETLLRVELPRGPVGILPWRGV